MRKRGSLAERPLPWHFFDIFTKLSYHNFVSTSCEVLVQLTSYGSVIFGIVALIVAVVAVTLMQGSPEKRLISCAQLAIDRHKMAWFNSPSGIIRCYRVATGEFVIEFLNQDAACLSPHCRAQSDVFVVSPKSGEVHHYRMLMVADSSGMMPLPIGDYGTPRLPHMRHYKYANNSGLEEWVTRLQRAVK